MRRECLRCGAHTFRSICGNCGSDELRPVEPGTPKPEPAKSRTGRDREEPPSRPPDSEPDRGSKD